MNDLQAEVPGWLEPADGWPAVILGEGITALGVTRCLARRGVPVFHLSPSRAELLRHSRWYRPIRSRRPRCLSDPAALEATLAAGIDGPVVLFPCDDASVLAAARLEPGAKQRFRACLPDPGAVEGLLDKEKLASAARRAGVPHPPTLPIRSVEELEELDSRWFRRALVKPKDSLGFFRTFGVKSFPVQSRFEAEERFRRVEGTGHEVLLQRYVPGPPSAHLFLDGFRSADGDVPGLLVRRRERMHPPLTGSSSATITVRPEEGETAARYLEGLFTEVDFHGIFSAEFKEDAEDGETRLLEVNVRPWWYVEFAARCGVDVCRMAYREAIGQRPEPVDGYQVGRRCVHSYHDVFAALRENREGRLGLLRWLASWLNSDRITFAWDDPAPSLHSAWKRAQGFVARRSRLSGSPLRHRTHP